MPLPPPPPGVAASLTAGVAAGIALTAADVYGAAALGTPLPPALWAFLAAHYATAGALAAVLAERLLFRARAPLPAAERALGWMLPLVGAVYAVAVVNQNLLRGEWGFARRLAVSALALAAVAAGAAWQERRLRRAGPASTLARCAARLLSFALFLALIHEGLALFGEASPLAVALALPAAAAAATAVLVLPLAAAGRWRGALPVLGLAALAAVVAYGGAAWEARTAARLRDAPQPAPPPGADRPNVLLVVIDTVRAGHVSAYGYARRTTPHLDALAAQGVRHANATTPYGWSLAAHASLFTGLYPREHGVGLRAEEREAAVLDPRLATLAEALSELGYATAGVSANPLVSRAFGLDQGFRYFHAGGPSTVHARAHPLLRRIENRVWPEALRAHLRERFRLVFPSATDVTDEALAWLARPRAQPFFLFLNYMDAHAPRRPRPGFSDRWPAEGGDEPLPAWAQREEPGRPLTPRQQQALVRYYDGALAYLDQELGRLLRGLEALPGGDRTWIIVASDHGEMLGEHGRLGHHCNVYEELLRVPLIVRHPRGMAAPPPGTVDDAPVQLVDIAPRVLSALGKPGPDVPRPGPAMLSVFECSCGPVHAALHGDRMEAIADGGLKYVEESGRPPRLFDLVHDPGEAADLHAQRPGDARALKERLDHWRAALTPRTPPALDPDSAREREDALRALGYIQ